MSTRVSGRPRVVVYGSLAYDLIMDFPGRFADYVMVDKRHVLNFAFGVKEVRQSYGGTAGNIAYTLGLLGERPWVMGSVGNNFAPYARWLKRCGVGLSLVHRTAVTPTAAAYVITDQDDNQLACFCSWNLPTGVGQLKPALLRRSFVVVSPGDRAARAKLVALCQGARVPYLYDVGKGAVESSQAELRRGIRGAAIAIGNDYELTAVARKLKVTEQRLATMVPLLIRTFGKHGSEFWYQGKRHKLPAVRPRRTLDPTGAGDAYVAGFVFGYVRGWSPLVCGRLAALTAGTAVECYGTQNHRFSLMSLRHKYRQVFKSSLP